MESNADDLSSDETRGTKGCRTTTQFSRYDSDSRSSTLDDDQASGSSRVFYPSATVLSLLYNTLQANMTKAADPSSSASQNSAGDDSLAVMMSKSSLTCHTTLVPPLLTIGVPNGGEQEDSSSTTTTLSYRDPSPAWQLSFSLDGSWLVVAVGSPSSCVRVYHQHPSRNNISASARRQGQQQGHGQRHDTKQQNAAATNEPEAIYIDDNDWILHATLMAALPFGSIMAAAAAVIIRLPPATTSTAITITIIVAITASPNIIIITTGSASPSSKATNPKSSASRGTRPVPCWPVVGATRRCGFGN
jgi:hypothetical protein